MDLQDLRQLLGVSGDGALVDGTLLLALSPDGSRLAAACGTALVVCPLTTAPEGVPSSDEHSALENRRATHASAGPRDGPDLQGPSSSARSLTCGAPAGPPVSCQDPITALTWIAFAKPPVAAGSRSSGGGAGSPERRRSGGGASGGGGRVFASIQAMLEDADLQARACPQRPAYSVLLLLAGTRSGCLQLHDADSGAVLMRQAIHAGPVTSLAVRTWRMGLKPDDAVEDVTVGWSDALARLPAWELRAAATSCYAAAAAARSGTAAGGGGGGSRFGLWGSSAPAGPDIKPLAVQKWEVPGAVRGGSGRSCAVCVGQRPRDLYSLLQGLGSSASSASGKTIFIAGGGKPACLAALEVDEQAGAGGALSYIGSVATSVTSGVMGLARTARSVAAAPLSIGSGIRALMMNPLLAGVAPGAGGSAGAEAGPSVPLASFSDPSPGQRPAPTGLWRQFRDDGRTVLGLAPAPHGSLVAGVDGLGRVLLVEAGQLLVSRMWKGYRDAQVAWLEVPAAAVERRRLREQAQAEQPQSLAGEQRQPQSTLPPAGPSAAAAPRGSTGGAGPGAASAGAGAGGLQGPGQHALLLAIYAPRRQTLELWWPLHGRRLAATAVPRRARLLQRGGGGVAGGELGTWRVADVASAAEPIAMSPAGCLLCTLGGVEGAAGAGAGLVLQDVAALFGLA
ncbi:hypothetical protein HYH03_016809 [Edaphochlamys debaryana]|uniref:Rab3-GAP regulatory subunit N-terminal domain-containing protein n=1 Tax=Edaphochlamys debaryana TaxID=47281 RepID=A0A835XJ51_9CHLO|nr:hypothetical protein HYH03_016809 [Edaphochlamys debaryana]|eukprot:KAG2484394.1 hypothetical protein HYH03_016809 [Edaphochlamys debaryana]